MSPEQDLKVSDDRFVKDLRRMAEELDLMKERMEDQIKTLTEAYREEMSGVEVKDQICSSDPSSFPLAPLYKCLGDIDCIRMKSARLSCSPQDESLQYRYKTNVTRISFSSTL